MQTGLEEVSAFGPYVLVSREPRDEDVGGLDVAVAMGPNDSFAELVDDRQEHRGSRSAWSATHAAQSTQPTPPA